MNNILIVEDDKTQAQMLKDTINSKYPGWDITITNNFEDAMSAINQPIIYTLFLLDVQLNTETDNRQGFEFANEIRKNSSYQRTPILFLTSITDEGMYALSTFHCYNYISKPYTQENILFQIEQLLATGYFTTFIEIMDTTRIFHKINIEDIYMVESSNHLLTIHTTMSSYTTRQYTSLQKMQELLGRGFVQCHRKFLINTEFIDLFDKTALSLHIRGKFIPVSKTNLKLFKAYDKNTRERKTNDES